MFRILFTILLSLHALIHAMGFAKAFGYLQNSPITKNISRMAGLSWLLVLVLFLLSAIAFITRKESWPYMALIAVMISQVLIVMVWKDARFGTIANIIICIVAIIGLANVNLEKSLRKQVNALLMVTRPQPKIIDQEMLKGLPMAVQKWLQASGVIGHEMTQTIRLKQEGRMCTKQGGKWVNFSAEQYFNTLESDFIWHANVEMMPLLFMQGVDQFHNGQGDMQIKLLGIKPVASAKGTAEVNQGTLVRYLSEICWFPSEALNSNIRWEQTGRSSARANIEVGGTKASGEFFFDDNGMIRSFEAMRYGEFEGKSSLEKWVVNMTHTAVFHGIRIPDQSAVTWKLTAGDFTWLDLRITAIDYNIPELF